MAQANPTLQLEQQSIGKLLLEYSIPAIGAMVIMSLYNIIGSIFIGYGVGPMALTAMAVSFPFMNLQMAACLLVAVGGAAMCSIELGRKNNEQACRILGHVTLLSFIVAIIFGSISLLFMDRIIIFFGGSDDSLPYARDFMQIASISAPIFFFMMGLNNLCRASGYPRKALMTSVISVIVNLILAPIFIFIFEWGIRGAALAMVFAQSVSLAWLVMHFRNPESVVHFKQGIFRLDCPVVKSILGIGLSPFLMNVCACIIVIFVNQSLKFYGGDYAIGAYGVVNRLLMLFGMTIVGLTHGMQPIIGYNYGAGQAARVLHTLRYGVIIATIVTTTGFVLAQLFPTALARMFTDDPELIRLSVMGLRLCSVMFFLVGAQIVIAAYFQFIDMAPVAIFLSLTRQLLFLLPALLLLPGFLGLEGVWLSLPVSDASAFVVTVLLLLWSLKKGHLSRKRSIV